jgi:catechol 2,3-dioxygenase-like lactoylglutathione lyase family enzyme
MITGAEPQLFVSDVTAACDFYATRLGFTVAFTYGEPPFYAQVAREAARLNLRHADSPTMNPSQRHGDDDVLAATITLDDAQPLYEEYRAAGVEFAQSLRTEPWGARTFSVRDPDGNLILFAGPDHPA